MPGAWVFACTLLVAESPASGAVAELDALVARALAHHPALVQAAFAAEAARGRAFQARLPPNPTMEINGDELGDRTGPAGTWTAPRLSQQFVNGGKLRLAGAAADKETNQALLGLMSKRYALLAEVRQGYYESAALQVRQQTLAELVALADRAAEQTQKLFAAKQASRLEVLQMEVEAERWRAETEGVERERSPARARLAAVVGVPVAESAIDPAALGAVLPEYDLAGATAFVRERHPDVRAARTGIDRARLLLARAQAEPIPNVTLSAGFVRQNQNRSSDWMVGLSLPIPAWNRNQGGIQAARAGVCEAEQAAGLAELAVAERVAEAFRRYDSARRRAERYRNAILPKAEEAQALAAKAQAGGQFDSLRVLEAQRAVAQARLDGLKSLGEAWQAAAALSGLLLEDVWPAG